MAPPSSSTPGSGSTPPARRTTTATAGSCSTCCGHCAVRPPDGSGAPRAPLPAHPREAGPGGRGSLPTGASRGVGFATARALVDDGARVLLSARSAESVGKAAAELGGTPSAYGTVADLADVEAAQRLAAEAIERLGRLDGVLVSV